MSDTPSNITPDAFERILFSAIGDRESFPIVTERLEYGRSQVRLEFRPNQLRMGGSIAGPTLFALADTALFAAVLSIFGGEREAVTTDLTIRFLRRPRPGDTLAEATILYSGRRSASGEVTLFSAGLDEPVAKCLGGFALVGEPVDAPGDDPPRAD